MLINHVLPKRKELHDFLPLYVGYEKCASGHFFGPAIRDFFIIHYVKSGKGVVFINDTALEVSKGEAFVLCSGEMSKYVADEDEPWEYYWFAFSGTLAEKFRTLPSPVFAVSEEYFTSPVKLAVEDKLTPEYAAAQLFLLYGELFSNESQSEQCIVKKTASYINLNYMDNLSVDMLSEMVCLNRRYLSRIFKQQMGVSIMPYILQKRCDKAKEFLESGYNVCKTATMVGYGDPYTFSKMFKKVVGCSPSAFRK